MIEVRMDIVGGRIRRALKGRIALVEKMEARIALCKCKEGNRTYGVRFERMGDNWKYTWAFPVKEASARRENYDKTKIVGDLVPDRDYPGCPYCRTMDFVVCRCGKLSCHNGGDA